MPTNAEEYFPMGRRSEYSVAERVGRAGSDILNVVSAFVKSLALELFVEENGYDYKGHAAYPATRLESLR